MFADKFSYLLQKSNVTNYKLSKEINIPDGLPSNYKNGKRKPTSENLAKIADYFDVTTDYLLGRTEDQPSEFMNLHRIPVLGRISAGLPLYADEHVEGFIYTEHSGGKYFGLKVRGDSMNAAKMGDGDVVKKEAPALSQQRD